MIDAASVGPHLLPFPSLDFYFDLILFRLVCAALLFFVQRGSCSVPQQQTNVEHDAARPSLVGFLREKAWDEEVNEDACRQKIA